MNNHQTVTALAAQLEQQVTTGQLELPVLPSVATEVLSLCHATTTDAARLSAVIHNDPALAANILRVANSPAFVGNVPCGSLQQAISRLGMQKISEIAVAVAVKGRLFQGGDSLPMFRSLWQHAVLVGFFTKEIARARRRNVEVAFLCGLLHDIGKPVMLTNLAPMQQAASWTEADLEEAIDARHNQVGRSLVAHWQLPEQIAESVEFHHEPTRAQRFPDIAAMVSLADLVAHEVTAGDREQPVLSEELRRHPVLATLNFYPDQLDQLLQRTAAGFELAEGMA
jgi:putative nucleotidyltransferase with HDIG domain